MKKFIYAIALFFSLQTFTLAGTPDEDLHNKCIYPTVMVQSGNGSWTGTGVVVTSRNIGHWRNVVWTAAHVIKGQTQYNVLVPKWKDWSTFVKWERYEAELVRIDVNSDVAVLSFKSTNKQATAEINWKPSLYIGNRVVKVGCGNSQRPRVDFGQITSLTEDIATSGAVTVRTNICTYLGDSGGPVFHNYRLVGIQLAVDGNSNGISEHISYYVPVGTVFTEGDLR